MKTIILDTETYHNFFLLSMMDLETGKVVSLRRTVDQEFDSAKARKIMAMHKTVSFNGIGYDLPLICLAIGGESNEQIKKMSDTIIKSKNSFQVIRDSGIDIPAWDHIDIMHVAPGQAGLKLYGGRIDSQKLQGLPYHPDTILTPDQMDLLEEYCVNDLRVTADLYLKLLPQIELREKMGEMYGMDLRSKGDAQIAEAVLRHELEKAGIVIKRPSGFKSGTTFHYSPPEWITFDDPDLSALLQDARQTVFKVQPQGSVALPEKLARKVNFAGAQYAIGIGGLHSGEVCQAVKPGPDEVLFDADFASYYPAIILGEGYYPKHLTPKFLNIYKDIVTRRLKAKAEGDKVTADSLKIVVNSSFGKMGSKYSFLYSPDLLISVTLTGQLALLMLIERVTQAGGKVMSANTDGIVVLCNRSKMEAVRSIMFEFELISGFTLEETQYKAIYSESVNNYLAVCPGGKVKGKGNFAPPGLMKNPQFSICSEAIREWASNNIDIEQYINTCSDVRKFVAVRKVEGGAVWGDMELGRVVRWYIGKNGRSQPIKYAKNGNRVPRSENAIPLMDLTNHVPDDLDRDWYVSETKKMLQKIGAAGAQIRRTFRDYI